MKYYTSTHEWIDEEGKVGISTYAANEVKDVVYIELPQKRIYKKGEVLATLETVKAVFEIYAPCDLEVLEVNEKLRSNVELINTNAEGEGYICKVKVISKEVLMTPEEYIEFLKQH
ncbi:MAG: glycine cleavage system protein H [bacterium]|nr:glycine cleavage system protein H [bacterium]